VVSLLPGEVTPAAGENAEYQGASADGSAVAFDFGKAKPLYLRVDNTETLIGGPAVSQFAGLSAEGRYLFYRSAGNLFRFDSEEGETLQITGTGDITPTIVSAQGTAAYFLSPSTIGAEPGPNGSEPQTGEENLYHWDGEEVRFVAAVTEKDASGDKTQSGGFEGGLGLWLDNVGEGDTSRVSARTSADGSVLLFESRADLDSFESAGKAQIYRYDSLAGTLACLSCDPTQALPTSDARLIAPEYAGERVIDPLTQVPNLSPDGRRAFFESSERLLPSDNDGVQDVYEWEAEGKGSCADPGGCLFLISSGQSARPNYIFGVSESGDDVFIHSSDLLVAEDGDETPSIYDARVLGGFAEPNPSAECLGDACQPSVSTPGDPTPGLQGRGGNVKGKLRVHCAKGRRKVRRAGKARCLRRQHRHQHRAAARRKGGHR
jgi:hypothetical protein